MSTTTKIDLNFELTKEPLMVFMAIGVSQWIACYVIATIMYNPRVSEPSFKYTNTSKRMTVSFLSILRQAYSEQPLFMRRIIDAYFVKALFYFIAFSVGFYSGMLDPMMDN